MFTVLGSHGFIGSYLVRYLKSQDIDCFTPAKYEDISGIRLGHIMDCTGLSADFRTKSFETVESHVCHTLKTLKQCKFESYLYLSSTRVYGIRDGIAREDDVIQCNPLDFNDIYNISKVMGESLCFATGQHNVRIARLSNVYGYDEKSENFIFTLIRDALHNNKIVLNTSLDSSKDHINVEDVVRVLPKISIDGKHQIYNVASGENVTVGQITKKLNDLTGCSVEVSKNAQRICYPIISIDRIRGEFEFSFSSIIGDLEVLVGKYKEMEK